MSERETKQRAVKILARTMYRDLIAQGFDDKQIVAFASELISEVTSSMVSGREAGESLSSVSTPTAA